MEIFLLSPLRATTIALAIVGRAITLEREIKKRSKELIRGITLQGAIEKRHILKKGIIRWHHNYFVFWGHQ